MLKILLMPAIALLALVSPVSLAQSLTPAGEEYTSPARIGGYDWFSGTTPMAADQNTILYDGKTVWETDDPIKCFSACEAFLGCTAFIFAEPLTAEEVPTCSMLRAAPDPVVKRGSQLYIRKH